MLTLDTFTAVAISQGLSLPPHRLQQAWESYNSFLPALQQLRDIDLSFLYPVVPDAALQWIEEGGRTRDRDDDLGPGDLPSSGREDTQAMTSLRDL